MVVLLLRRSGLPCAWLVALLAVGLGGCTTQGVAWTLAPIQQVAPFSPSGQADVSDPWWMAFEDSSLNREIDRALYANFTLAAAWERVRAAILTNIVAFVPLMFIPGETGMFWGPGRDIASACWKGPPRRCSSAASSSLMPAT